MYRSFLSCVAFVALQALAQQQVHQVFALSEGYYDYFNGQGQLVPVTLGSYDPVTGTYQTVATITGPRFGSDVLVDNGSVYVAADDRIVRFDADSYLQTGETMVQGVRKLAIWNDKLLLTRGELGGLDHYFEVRDKNTLDLLWSLDPADGLTMSAEDVVVVGDKAYLAVNNSFDWANLAGKVGVVDLMAQTYGPEIDLGPNGLNPEKLFVVNGALHAFNNKDFTGSSISTVDIDGAMLTYTHDVAANSGCAASAYAAEKIYFMEYSQGEIARYDIATAQVQDTLSGSPSVYGLVEDAINQVMYATTTDFSTSGDLHVLDMNGQVISTVAATMSIGNLDLDIRTSTGIAPHQVQGLSVYPNPAQDRISISRANNSASVEVMDAAGRTVLSLASRSSVVSMDITALQPGCYVVRNAGLAPVRFVKH